MSVLSLLLLGACSTQKQDTSKESNAKEHIVISNYTNDKEATTWTPTDITFDKRPSRVLANTRPAAELLLHLGINKEIVGVGADFGVYDDSVKENYKQLNHLSTDYIGKETALSVSPDLVYGRGGLFANEDWGTGTTSELKKMGVNSFVLSSSVNNATFESVYEDIKNTGRLFGKEKEATAFSDDLKKRQSALESAIKDTGDMKSFAYIHSVDPKELMVYSAHGESFFNHIFNMIHLDNAFKDVKGDVSIESLIETNPDILILPRWNSDDPASYKEADDKLIQGILTNPKLATLKAVQTKQVYVVDYNYMFGYGYQSLDGMEQLAQEIYPNAFK